MAFLPIIISPKASTGMTTTKVSASLPPMMKAIITANRNISGERMAMRISIINVNCTLFISVVIRVTSEAVENLSMFSKEKLCMRENMS